MYAFGILGIPAHPLVVHGAVVGIPLASLAMLAYVLRPSIRTQWWPLVFATVAGAWLCTLLAGSTGESLQHALPHARLIEDHVRLAGLLGVAVHVMSAAAAVILLHDRLGVRLAARGELLVRRLRTVAVPLVVAAAFASLVLVALTGHAGAKAAWQSSPAVTGQRAG